MTTSFCGLRLRSASERARDRNSAAADLDAIEAAEAEFRNLVTAWALCHPTYAGEKAMPHIESFLTDYFDHERRAAEEDDL